MQIPAWSPLRSVASEAKEVLPLIYEVQENLFLRAQPYNERFEQDAAAAPYVTLLYWAASFSALERQVKGDETIPASPGAKVPSALLLGTNGTYEELKKALSARSATPIETASYTNKGDFLFKEISGNGLTYCFTSPDIVAEQTPCLVKIKLGRTA